MKNDNAKKSPSNRCQNKSSNLAGNNPVIAITAFNSSPKFFSNGNGSNTNCCIRMFHIPNFEVRYFK